MRRVALKSRFPVTPVFVLAVFLAGGISSFPVGTALRAQDAQPAGALRESRDNLSDLGDDELDLIHARVLNRRGDTEGAVAVVKALLDRDPGHEEARLVHAEILVDGEEYEAGMAAVGALLRENSNNKEALRLEARIYQELGRARLACPVYEELLRVSGVSGGVYADYAFSRLDRGEWSAALDCFSRTLEIDPENRSVRQSVHEILKEHNPRLDLRTRVYRQSADGSCIFTWALSHRRYLDENTLVEAGFERIRINRPARGATGPISRGVNGGSVRAEHRFGETWSGRLGAGSYTGLRVGSTLVAGLDCRIHERLVLRGDLFQGRPWYDPVEAADHEGSFNRRVLSLEWQPDRVWSVALGAEQWDYFIDDSDRYGRRYTQTAILTRSFTRRPDFSLSYSIHHATFNADDRNFQPIAMLRIETVHGLSGRFEDWPGPCWAYFVGGGVRSDVARSVNSWYVHPGLKIRLGNRIDIETGYEFSSEAGTVEGGRTQTFFLQARIIF
jgi:tetratricopeptide (TPR) repeat protein